jgi:hypothetical protein
MWSICRLGVGAMREDVADSGRALFRLDVASGAWSPIVYTRSAEDIDVWPKVSPDGRWIAFQRNLSLSDLWRTDLDLSAAREIDRVVLQPRIRTVVAAADGAWFLDSRPDCRWYWRRLAVPANTEGHCLGSGRHMLQGISYDPVHRQIYAGIADEVGRDIGVLPLRAFGLAGDAVARRD